MEQQLALFPLQLVVFPGESLNLHIFEPRYRQLVTDAEEQGIRFGVPTVIEGRLQPVGTEVSLTEVAQRYPGGESDVRTRGERVFYLQEYDRTAPGKLYPGGRVRYLPVEEEEDPAVNDRIIALTREIYRQLKVSREVRSVDEGFRTYEIAHYVGFTLTQEYEFLKLRAANKRQHYLLAHLRQMKPHLGDPLRIRERAQLNGHFKDLKPPDF
nr:LON peptidase substrate-binding domain-containing protein [Lewinella sp. JB7]